VAKLPAGKVALSAAAMLGRTVYLFGGCSMPEPGKVQNHAEAFSFDTDTFAFRRLRDLPVPNRGLTAAAVDGRILLFGGYATEFVADVHSYDPATDTYTRESPMPLAMSSAEFVVDGNRLIAAGGEDRMKHRSARTIVATVRGGA
jgi:N-acetylneuraminic acid mutarotase